jgi:hypothetical protein
MQKPPPWKIGHGGLLRVPATGGRRRGGGLVDAEAQAARRVVDGVSPLDGRRVGADTTLRVAGDRRR